MNNILMPLLAGAVVLTGCAGTHSDFGCNAISSDSCMTIDAANNLARQKAKEVEVQQGAASLPNLVKPGAAGVPLTSTVPQSYFSREPVRMPESTAKVWIAAWVDDQDNVHEPGMLSFVVKPGEWRQ